MQHIHQIMDTNKIYITHYFNNRNTIINPTERLLPALALRTIMDIPYNPRGEVFMHPKRIVSRGLHIITILRRWRGPLRFLHPLFNYRGMPFFLLLIHRIYSELPQRQKLRASLQKAQRPR